MSKANSWATSYIARLLAGEIVDDLRPHGASMKGLIEAGQRVTIRPRGRSERVKKGQIVLCTVNRKDYLHKVVAVRGAVKLSTGQELGGSVLIGNNHGKVNGWTPLNCVYGIVTKVED